MTAFAAGVLGYRKAYGTWLQAPDRIDFCGRQFLRGTPGLTRADIGEQVTATRDGGSAPVQTVAEVPPLVGQPLLAALTPRAEQLDPGGPCTMVVYLKTGADAYTAYGLSGGP
ncbi:MAG: hypothetical protein ACOH17_03485 [Cellulomonas sp.]